MSSRAGHVTTETVFGQTLAVWLGNEGEYCTLELDTAELNVKGGFYLYLCMDTAIKSWFWEEINGGTSFSLVNE